MKLIIQIPCFNESETLPITLKELPREVEGCSSVEWLIIDDGSSDDTSSVAKNNGVDHVVRFSSNKGLAAAFLAGLDASIKAGADIVVNTDADNQYCAADIPKLVAPIVKQQADMVIGTRPISDTKDFSPLKKVLQKVGSKFVRIVSRTKVEDAPSGFRAFSKEAALKLNVFNGYTYTLETIVQAGSKNITIKTLPIRTNGFLRPSRLMKSIPAYIKKSVLTVLRIFVVYRPFKFFLSFGLFFFVLGLIGGLRFLHFYLIGEGDGHVQSLILTSILLGFGVQFVLIAFVADLLSVNRQLLEDVRYRIRNLELND